MAGRRKLSDFNTSRSVGVDIFCTVTRKNIHRLEQKEIFRKRRERYFWVQKNQRSSTIETKAKKADHDKNRTGLHYIESST